MKVPARCLECGLLGHLRESRCITCYRRAQRRRNAIRTQYTGDWPAIRKAVLAAHPWCETCPATTDLTVDHVVPVARGGTHARHNLRVLCRSCNSTKGAR